MPPASPFDIHVWWRAARPLVVPIAQTPSQSAADCERALRALWSDGEVALPDDFKAYLDVIDGHVWLGQRIDRDFLMVPAASLSARLSSALERYEPDVIRRAGLWLDIASRGDRDGIFLCCDRSRGDFGCVAFGEDAHPWLDGVASLDSTRQRFDRWLTSLLTARGGKHWATRGTVLLALTDDEQAQLARARATGDARAMLVAVNDLVELLTPDNAWSHTLHATARALLADDDGWLRVSGEPLFTMSNRRATLLSPSQAADLAHAFATTRPALPAHSVLRWSEQHRSLRRVDDAAGAACDFVRRAADARHALLIVVER